MKKILGLFWRFWELVMIGCAAIMTMAAILLVITVSPFPLGLHRSQDISAALESRNCRALENYEANVAPYWFRLVDVTKWAGERLLGLTIKVDCAPRDNKQNFSVKKDPAV